MEILSKERDPKAANKALSAVRIPFSPVIHSFLSTTLRPPSSAPCAISPEGGRVQSEVVEIGPRLHLFV